MKIISILLKFHFLCLLSKITSLEYKKNKHIKMSGKNEKAKRILEVSQVDTIKNKINLKKSNFLIVFYADWCVHCKEFLETIDTVSTYDLSKGFDFLKVNCTEYKHICDEFNVNHYPTIRVFLKGVETNLIPNGRDVETLLEYVDKVNSPSIVYIKSNKEIKKFSENYGDVSFLLVDKDDYESSLIFKCFDKLANSAEYKPLFYFAYIKKSIFRNENDIKLPAVIVSRK